MAIVIPEKIRPNPAHFQLMFGSFFFFLSFFAVVHFCTIGKRHIINNSDVQKAGAVGP